MPFFRLKMVVFELKCIIYHCILISFKKDVFIECTFWHVLFFSGELNQSLPKMVVDILETKLDDDYIDYIANMILKNASSSEDSGHNINSQEVPSVPENRSTGCTADNKLERNKDLPDNWTVMDRKKVSF